MHTRDSEETVLDTSAYRVYWASSHALTVEIKNGVTDADSSRWPTRTEKAADQNGNANYDVSASDDKQSEWKEKLGGHLRTVLIIPELEEKGWDDTLLESVQDAHITLLDFPEGYKLYHHMSQEYQRPRTDTYLYGSTWVRYFRSPREFAMHLKWLLDDRPLTGKLRPNCKCRWCSKVSQTEIDRKYLFLKVSPHKNQTHSRGSRPPKRPSPPFEPKTTPNLTWGLWLKRQVKIDGASPMCGSRMCWSSGSHIRFLLSDIGLGVYLSPSSPFIVHFDLRVGSCYDFTVRNVPRALKSGRHHLYFHICCYVYPECFK